MRRALLLYNPASGRGEADRAATLQRVQKALEERGLSVEIAATQAAGTAGRQAAEACVAGIDILFACGGDGTMHEVLQGMVGQSAALGILPLGSANALARHLGLSLDPLQAALQQLSFQPQLIPAGKVTYQSKDGERSRYFLVMAGAGPDGMLVYRMLAGGKRRLGRTLYYLRAGVLFLRHPFSAFNAAYLSKSEDALTQQVVSAMAVRVGDLGGLFSPLVRGADLRQPYLRLTLAKVPGRISLFAWFALGWARLQRYNRYIEIADVIVCNCSSGEDSPVQVQADGEWLGQTPMRIELVEDAVRLLMPSIADGATSQNELHR